MKTLLLLLMVFSTAIVCATASASTAEPSSAMTPEALFQQGLGQELVLDPSGVLTAWNQEVGKGYVLGREPKGAKVIAEFQGRRNSDLAVSPTGSRAYLQTGSQTLEIQDTHGEQLRVDLGQEMGDLVWLDDQRVAVSPLNGDYLVEIWNAESGKRLAGIEQVERISEAPGCRVLRETQLAWDAKRQRLHALDAFSGYYRAFDLSNLSATEPGQIRSKMVLEARIDDQNRSVYEKRLRVLDRQFAEQGEFTGAGIWRFSAELDSEGTAWMVERCDAEGDETNPWAGTAHLLSVDSKGTEQRVAVATSCCSLQAVPWAESLAFAQSTHPGRRGCFATVARPSLEASKQAAGWAEVTPLSASSDRRSRHRSYVQSIVERLGATESPAHAVGELGAQYKGLALVCTGGAVRPLDCQQLWVDATSPEPGQLYSGVRPGRAVTGQVAVAGVGVPGASIALTPATFRATRPVTLPLSLPPGKRKPIRKIATDHDGRFTLPVLAPGDYRLVVELPGGRIDHDTTFSVSASGRRQVGEVSPKPLDLGVLDFAEGVTLEAMIHGPDGQPIPGAEAGAAQADSDRQSPNNVTLFRAEAGPDGRAVIRGLDAALPVLVTCNAPGHESWRVKFDSPPAFADCSLDPFGQLKGRVVSEDGEPLAEAVVTLNGGSGLQNDAVETFTLDKQDEGRFEFDDLEAARLQLVASSPGRTSRRISVDLESGEARDVGELVLPPGSQWLQHVVDGSDGEPIAGASVTAFSPLGAVAPSTTDSDGEVEVAGPATGPLVLEVRAAGFAPRRVEIPEDVRTLDADPYEIVLERGGWILAHVWDKETGLPCAGCRVTVSGSGPLQGLVTDGSGTARSEPLTPGTWQASLESVQGYGGMITRSGGDNIRAVTVASGKTTDVRFGAPAETLEVFLSPPPSEPGTWDLFVEDGSGSKRTYRLDASGAATVQRPRGGAVLSLTGSNVTVDLGTIPEDAPDPLVVSRGSGVLTGRLSLSSREGQPESRSVWLRLVDLSSGRTTAEIDSAVGAELHVPFLPSGTYVLEGDGRSLATATIVDGQQTDLGEIR